MSVTVTGPITLSDLDALIDGLQAQVEGLSGTDANFLLSHVSRSVAKLSAYRVALVAKVDRSQVWRDQDPNATAASFLREQHTLDHREAKADLRAAKSCERFPELGQACRDGLLSQEKMNLILSVGLRNPQREAALPEFLSIFITLAQEVSTSQLRSALELWASQIDPVTTSSDDNDAHMRRELHVSHLGDGVKLDGFFGKEQGMRLITALNGVLDQQWRATHRETSQRTSDTDQVVASTPKQRADAFIEGIVGPVLEQGLVPTAGGAPATINVTVPLAVIQNPDQPAANDEIRERTRAGSLRHHSAILRAPNGPGEALVGGHTALHLSCDATIRRVVLSPTGQPLEIGRKTRLIPEHLRTALIIRDGGCIFPNCGKPPGWTHAHHIQHWSHGGPTNLSNLALLCQRHHHQIHHDNISITMIDGKPRVVLKHQFKDQS